MVLRAVLVAATLVGGVSAQAPGPPSPPRDRPASVTGTATIRGRVTAVGTGQPLRNVQIRVISLTANTLREPRAAMTDDDGRYELTQLPQGRYQLHASRGGYVDVEYGQRRPFERGRPVELTDQQTLAAVDFVMPRGAAIEGRVVDEIGEPVAGASIQLGRYRYTNGTRQLQTSAGGSTDDRGEFRIFGIAAGEYFLVASFDEHDFGSSDRQRYVPTYYPGVTATADAQPVAIKAGAEVTGISLSLLRATTASVSGIVRPADLQSPGLLTFVVATPVAESAARMDFAPAIAGPDGAFTIGGLLPGSYVIEARSMPGNEVGKAEILIDSQDVAGILLPLSKGSAARGRIRFDTGAPPADVKPSQLFVFAPSVDHQAAAWSMDGDPSRPTVREDWTFEIPNLTGRRQIRAGTAARWHLKSVHLNGQDITDTAVDFRNGDVDGIEIELTNRTTAVSGTVLDDRGATVIDAAVVLFADDRDKWGSQTRYIMSARPNQQGRFSLEGLPPGQYLAVAVDPLEQGDEYNPELLEQWRSASTRVRLAEGESRTLNLQLSRF
jgi:5-hydroxyisourate hydrolase-like protein (transthyretin family)